MLETKSGLLVPSSVGCNSPDLFDHERPQWRVLTQVEKYDGVDVDWYRKRYGRENGEARFRQQHKPSEIVTRAGNLLLIGGASVLWECLIGNGTSSSGQSLTFFNNANAYIAVGDGGPTAITGTVSVTNGSTAVTFSTSQTGLVGTYLVVTGDSTNAVYKIASGSGTSYTLATAYGGSTNASASSSYITAEVATQTDLLASSNKTRNVVDATYPLHTDGTSSKTITAATNATPIQITASSHGFSTGDFVANAGVLGNTAANGIFQITVVDSNNFTLNGSTGNGSYTSGGFSSKFPVLVFKSTFGTSAANFPWYEWGIANASSSGRMLNRKVTPLGTKTSAASWAFTVGIGLQ